MKESKNGNPENKENEHFPDRITDTILTATDNVSSIGDTALSVMTDIKFFDNIPILKLFSSTLKTYNFIQQKRIQRNTEAFLLAVSKRDKEKIKKFRTRLLEDTKFSENCAETILFLISESSTPLKLSILGNWLLALSEEKISKEEFDLGSQIIEAAMKPSLIALKSFLERITSKSAGQNQLLFSTGLHSPNIPEEPLLLPLGVFMRHGNKASINEIGKKLYLFGLHGKEAWN